MSSRPSATSVDPRTDLPQADIPSTGMPNFDVLSECVVHWFSVCALIGGGSQRTDPMQPSTNAPVGVGGSEKRRYAAASSSSGKPPLPQPPSAAEAAALSSFSFVFVISDSCVYIFDRSAVIIRCIPIATIDRVLLVDLAAKDAKSAELVRGHAAKNGVSLAEASLQLVEPARAAPQHHHVSRITSEICCTILGFSLLPDQSTVREHDLIIGVPLGAAEAICGILLRIHWAHLGPNVKLPIESIDMTPIRGKMGQQVRRRDGGHNDMDEILPTILDIHLGIDEAAIPPLLGLNTNRSAHWELRVEPFRRWSQLEALLGKKHAMLIDEEVAIEAAFRRIKAALTEHATIEERDRWRLMTAQNQKLAETAKALDKEVTIARKLLDQEVPGGLDLLRSLSAHDGPSGDDHQHGRGGGTILEHMGTSALFDGNESSSRQRSNGADSHAGDDVEPFFMSPIAHRTGGSASRANLLSNSYASQGNMSRGASSVGRCTKCRELEYLVESHPNVDKIRILKAEEALVSLQRKLEASESLMLPLRNENAELRGVITKMMRELVHAHESEAKLRRKQSSMSAAATGDESPAVRALYSKSFEVGVRNAIRTGEPYYRIEIDATSGQGAQSDQSPMSMGNEIRQWRLLCAEMERRHRQELKDLYTAFTMYDDIMSQSVHEALRQYEPTPNVDLEQATMNILSVAKSRAREAKAAAGRVKRGGADNRPASTANVAQTAPASSLSYAGVWSPEATGNREKQPAPWQHSVGGNQQHHNNIVSNSHRPADRGTAHSSVPYYSSGMITSPGPLDSMVRWAEI